MLPRSTVLHDNHVKDRNMHRLYVKYITGPERTTVDQRADAIRVRERVRKIRKEIDKATR
jgi:hypothetical protein